jgi:hypothetical protein
MKTSVIKLGPEMFEKDGRSVQEDIESAPSSFDEKRACMIAQPPQAQSDYLIWRYQTLKGSTNLSRVGNIFIVCLLCFLCTLSLAATDSWSRLSKRFLKLVLAALQCAP